jgi:AraC-like DNA-binding protein
MQTPDALTDILRRLRLRAEVFLHARFCGAWVVDIGGQGKAAFHVVAQGDCWLHLPDREPRPLGRGDLVVLPRDAPHTISNQPQAPGPGIPRNRPALADDSGPSVSLICGYFAFGSRAWNAVVDALPEVLVLRPGEAGDAQARETLIGLLINEAEAASAGSAVVLDRLADALFVLAVRAAMDQGTAQTGILAAVADRHLSRALRALHGDPAHPWTLETLARQAGLSRSAFAARFHALTGLTPMRYLARWRLQLARDWLSEGGLGLMDVAERAGYGSEAAFSRAFKRELGLTPGQARRGPERAEPPQA